MSTRDTARSWHFVTNHTQVLLCISANPEIRLRDIATRVGITERAAQRIVHDLVQEGYVTRERTGRRNHYAINRTKSMRHPAQFGFEVGPLLDLLRRDADDALAEQPRPATA
jgi:predicted ArsR family transcriptional regulator